MTMKFEKDSLIPQEAVVRAQLKRILDASPDAGVGAESELDATVEALRERAISPLHAQLGRVIPQGFAGSSKALSDAFSNASADTLQKMRSDKSADPTPQAAKTATSAKDAKAPRIPGVEPNQQVSIVPFDGEPTSGRMLAAFHIAIGGSVVPAVAVHFLGDGEAAVSADVATFVPDGSPAWLLVELPRDGAVLTAASEGAVEVLSFGGITEGIEAIPMRHAVVQPPPYPLHVPTPLPALDAVLSSVDDRPLARVLAARFGSLGHWGTVTAAAVATRLGHSTGMALEPAQWRTVARTTGAHVGGIDTLAEGLEERLPFGSDAWLSQFNELLVLRDDLESVAQFAKRASDSVSQSDSSFAESWNDVRAALSLVDDAMIVWIRKWPEYSFAGTNDRLLRALELYKPGTEPWWLKPVLWMDDSWLDWNDRVE